MTVGGFKILRDGETVIVSKIGFNKTKQIETLAPVAYVRDMLAGLEAVQRRMTAKALGEEEGVEKLMKLLKKQHKELIDAVKKAEL